MLQHSTNIIVFAKKKFRKEKLVSKRAGCIQEMPCCNLLHSFMQLTRNVAIE